MEEATEYTINTSVLKQELKIKIKETKELAILSKNLKYLKKIFRIEKVVDKNKSNNILRKCIFNLEKIQIQIEHYNENGSSIEYTVFSYTIMMMAIMMIIIKTYTLNDIETLNSITDLHEKLRLQTSIGLYNLLVTLLAGVVGFCTYLYAHLSQNRKRFSDKLVLAILFPVILLLIFTDVSQSFELAIPAFLCFAVGYNYEILLLFANKILEKVKETIEKI